LAKKSNSNIFEIYLATKNIPYPAPPVADFLAKKSNSNIFEIYLATKKHHHTPLPAHPIAVFWPGKVIQIFLKYIWRQKNTTLTHSPAPCDFFVMKSNSNNFEYIWRQKKHHPNPFPAPPIAVFLPRKVIQIILKYIWRQKNTTIPRSPRC
jgi:hypothetical protein